MSGETFLLRAGLVNKMRMLWTYFEIARFPPHSARGAMEFSSDLQRKLATAPGGKTHKSVGVSLEFLTLKRVPAKLPITPLLHYRFSSWFRSRFLPSASASGHCDSLYLPVISNLGGRCVPCDFSFRVGLRSVADLKIVQLFLARWVGVRTSKLLTFWTRRKSV